MRSVTASRAPAPQRRRNRGVACQEIENACRSGAVQHPQRARPGVHPAAPAATRRAPGRATPAAPSPAAPAPPPAGRMFGTCRFPGVHAGRSRSVETAATAEYRPPARWSLSAAQVRPRITPVLRAAQLRPQITPVLQPAQVRTHLTPSLRAKRSNPVPALPIMQDHGLCVRRHWIASLRSQRRYGNASMYISGHPASPQFHKTGSAGTDGVNARCQCVGAQHATPPIT